MLVAMFSVSELDNKPAIINLTFPSLYVFDKLRGCWGDASEAPFPPQATAGSRTGDDSSTFPSLLHTFTCWMCFFFDNATLVY